MAAGTISLVAVLRDARILRQALRSALLRTRLTDDVEMFTATSMDKKTEPCRQGSEYFTI